MAHWKKPDHGPSLPKEEKSLLSDESLPAVRQEGRTRIIDVQKLFPNPLSSPNEWTATSCSPPTCPSDNDSLDFALDMFKNSIDTGDMFIDEEGVGDAPITSMGAQRNHSLPSPIDIPGAKERNVKYGRRAATSWDQCAVEFEPHALLEHCGYNYDHFKREKRLFKEK